MRVDVGYLHRTDMCRVRVSSGPYHTGAVKLADLTRLLASLLVQRTETCGIASQ